VLPGPPWATGYEVVVDTTYAGGLPPPGNDRPPAGLELPMVARSAVLLRVVRDPLAADLS
jgi:isoamylase